MKKHLSITVKGNVQGVYFRRDTQIEAQRLGVHGTVANLEDGSVFIEAEAEEATLNQFVEWCKQGPPLARVDNLQIEQGKLQDFASFDVLAEPSDFLG